MAIEDVPEGVPSDGFLKVWFAEELADPGKPTELEIETAIPLTYSITGDGYTHTVTVNKITSNRLALRNAVQYDGTVTHDLSIKYVYTNTENDVVRKVLVKGKRGYIIERWAVDNDEDAKAGQLVDVLPIQASMSTKDAPTTNTELTRTQALNITGRVYDDVKIAAA